MKVILFGATGMVGQGVMRECLLDPEVHLLQTVGRTATGAQDPKLREVVHNDLWRYESLEAKLSGFDACFFCLGVTSSGMTEENYERVTYGITIAAAEMLSRLNPQMTFIYVSGTGTDSSEVEEACGRESKEKRKMPCCGSHSKPHTCSVPALSSLCTEQNPKRRSTIFFTRSANHYCRC